jgi:hypothetical protein
MVGLFRTQLLLLAAAQWRASPAGKGQCESQKLAPGVWDDRRDAASPEE